MLILGRDRLKDPSLGYAKTFLRQLEECLGLAVDGGVKIVVNAGGLNPAGLAAAVRDARRTARPGCVASPTSRATTCCHEPTSSGSARRSPPTPTSARGASPNALAPAPTSSSPAGSPTPRSSSGPAAAHFGWAPRRTSTRSPAPSSPGTSSSAAPQATGGNFAFFTEIADAHATRASRSPRSHADGTSVITKHPGTGGAVTVGTVTAQLLYEIGGRALRRPGRHRPLRHDRAQRRRSRPGADQRRTRRAAAAHAQGRAQHARRVPQRGRRSC